MPQKRPSNIANLQGPAGQKWQKLNGCDKENMAPFPGQSATVEDAEESDDEEEQEVMEDDLPWTHSPFVLAGQYIPPPSLAEAASTLADLKLLIQLLRTSGIGHKDPKLDLLLPGCGWQAASLKTAHANEKSSWLAGRLREWTRAYILDWDDLPLNVYGTWNSSVLEDEDFKGELLLHLQGIGKYVRAMDIVDYVKRPDVLTQLKLKKPISLATAQRWMKHVGYHWTKTPTGQFVDGHERCDVIAYRQVIFLPVWAELLLRTQIFVTDGNECRMLPPTSPTAHHTVVWNRDESTYYANDHWKI